MSDDKPSNHVTQPGFDVIQRMQGFAIAALEGVAAGVFGEEGAKSKLYQAAAQITNEQQATLSDEQIAREVGKNLIGIIGKTAFVKRGEPVPTEVPYHMNVGKGVGVEITGSGDGQANTLV